MRHPRTMPDQFRRVMLAVVDPSGLKQFRRRANRAESRQMLDTVDGYGARKTLRLEHGETAVAQRTLACVDVAGLKHQSVQSARTFEHILAQDVRARRQPDQLQIVVSEHDKMIDRAERVVAARRQREAELRP